MTEVVAPACLYYSW